MNGGNIEVRRMTVDDLPKFRSFLQAQGLDPQPLEKRFSEFQLAFSASSEIVGILGLQLANQQGLIHSLTISKEADPALAGRLWERVQAVARNHGLFRIWSRNVLIPGLSWPQPTAKELERLPEAFGARTEAWHVLQLKEENTTSLSLDQEFQLFTQNQKEGSDKMMRQARFFKMIAYVVAILFGAIAGYMVIKTMLHPPPKRKF